MTLLSANLLLKTLFESIPIVILCVIKTEFDKLVYVHFVVNRRSQKYTCPYISSYVERCYTCSSTLISQILSF